jgi:CBS domain-containing protein
MAELVRDVMTADPACVSTSDTADKAAQLMRDKDVGSIVVTENGGNVHGIVTDRDIVVRAIADGMDPRAETVDAIYSGDVVTVSPDTAVDEAIRIMRERAVRRLPVLEGNRAVGIVSLGDLAIQGNGEQALADISAAPDNS